MVLFNTYIKRTLFIIILLSLAGHKSYAQNADINMLRSINLHRNKSLDGAMELITNSVYPLSAGIPIAELVYGYARHDEKMKMYGWQTIAGLGVNTILTTGFKYSINRTRPAVKYPDIDAYEAKTDHSFPSGHTSYAFYSATSLSICFPKWYVIAPGYALATLTGYSRMHLGVHYPTDVLAGAVIGTGSAWLAYQGNKWLQGRRKNKHVAME